MEPIVFNELEYNTLRAEVIKRIEMRQQLISITLTMAGVVMGFGISKPSLGLIFPPLSLFLTLLWAQNDIRAIQIDDYLHDFENDSTKLGWISYYKKRQKSGSFRPGWPLSVIAPGGIFILTSIMCIGIGVFKFKFSWLVVALLCIDFVSVVAIIWLVLFTRKNRISRRAT